MSSTACSDPLLGRVQRLLACMRPVRAGKAVYTLSYQAIESRRARSCLSSGRHSSTRDYLVSEGLWELGVTWGTCGTRAGFPGYVRFPCTHDQVQEGGQVSGTGPEI